MSDRPDGNSGDELKDGDLSMAVGGEGPVPGTGECIYRGTASCPSPEGVIPGPACEYYTTYNCPFG